MNQIIVTVNDVLFIFVPGIVCLFVYGLLVSRKYDVSTYTVFGITAGTLVKFSVDSVNEVLLKFYHIPFPIFFIYIIVAVFVAWLFHYVRTSIPISRFFAKHFGIGINDSFWERYFDLEHEMAVYVYTTDGKVSSGLVQSVDDSHINLLCHCTAKTAHGKDMVKADKHRDEHTILYIPMKNVIKMELGYINENSKKAKFALRRP